MDGRPELMLPRRPAPTPRNRHRDGREVCRWAGKAGAEARQGSRAAGGPEGETAASVAHAFDGPRIVAGKPGAVHPIRTGISEAHQHLPGNMAKLRRDGPRGCGGRLDREQRGYTAAEYDRGASAGSAGRARNRGGGNIRRGRRIADHSRPPRRPAPEGFLSTGVPATTGCGP